MWNEDARMTLYSNKCKPACVCVCVWTYLSVSVCECVRGKASRGRVLSGFGTPTTICNGAVTMTLCVCVGLYWICVCVCIRCQSVTEGQQQAVSVKASLELTTIHASPFPSHALHPGPTRATHFSCLPATFPLYFFSFFALFVTFIWRPNLSASLTSKVFPLWRFISPGTYAPVHAPDPIPDTLPMRNNCLLCSVSTVARELL